MPHRIGKPNNSSQSSYGTIGQPSGQTSSPQVSAAAPAPSAGLLPVPQIQQQSPQMSDVRCVLPLTQHTRHQQSQQIECTSLIVAYERQGGKFRGLRSHVIQTCTAHISSVCSISCADRKQTVHSHTCRECCCAVTHCWQLLLRGTAVCIYLPSNPPPLFTHLCTIHALLLLLDWRMHHSATVPMKALLTLVDFRAEYRWHSR